MALILIRYGEMGLKSSPVRRRFERRFVSNIQDFFARAGLECLISSDWGRIYLQTSKPAEAVRVLSHIFGIVSVSVAQEHSADLDALKKAAAEYAAPHLAPGMTFAVRAHRIGEHKYTSMEAGKELGSAIWLANENKKLKVDLKRPQFELFADIRNNKAYLYHEAIPCAGGLPLGTQGKVVVAFQDDGGRSAAAAWLLMKRGCRAHVAVRGAGGEWLKSLGNWDVSLPVHSVDGDLWAGALAVARKVRADALVSPGGPEPSMHEAAKAAGLPVFYPLFGLGGDEIDKAIRAVKS